MTGSSDLDLAAFSAFGVIAVEELLSAIEASRKKSAHAARHLGNAAIGAAVAVGALEHLRHEEAAGKDGSKRSGHEDNHKTNHSDK
jgi:hypothetical protein